MANGTPSGEGPRYQPEFSPGERLARLEAGLSRAAEDRQELQKQIDRRLGEAEKLYDEKLDGLGERLTAINSAQKEAVDKAEKATAQRFDTFVEQNERKAEVTQARLQALERGESQGEGIRRGANELKASTVAWLGALAALALAILYIAHP
jgi:hypothetical protein